MTLNKTKGEGKGSSKTVNVTVNVHAESRTPGSCTAGDASEPITLSLLLEDDDGDVILDESKVGYQCFGTGSNSVKFQARYTVKNCENSVPPQGSVASSAWRGLVSRAPTSTRATRTTMTVRRSTLLPSQARVPRCATCTPTEQM